MNVRTALAKLNSFGTRWISPTSLLFRLTAGTTLTVALGLTGMILWSNWTFHQGSVKVYEQAMDALTTSIVQTMAGDRPMNSSTSTLEAFVNQWSSSVTWLWVKYGSDEMMAKSEGMNELPTQVQSTLMSMPELVSQPVHYSVDGRHLLVQAMDVPMADQPRHLFIAQDITSFYTQWLTDTTRIAIAFLLYLPIFAWIVVFITRRSLRPLQQINRIASTNSTQLFLDYSKRLPDEVRELAMSYQRLFTQVSATEEHQRQFTNQISHELRTPLSLIYGYLQSLLKRSSNLTHAQQEALRVAADETEHMIQILQDLLDTERIRYLMVPSEPEVLDLNGVIFDVVTIAYKLTHRTIQPILEASPTVVTTDRGGLTQLLLYLLEQAVRHSSPEQAITIRIDHADDEVMILINVPSNQENITYSSDSPQLKLSIAHSLAKKINSQVKVLPNSDSNLILQIVLAAH